MLNDLDMTVINGAKADYIALYFPSFSVVHRSAYVMPCMQT